MNFAAFYNTSTAQSHGTEYCAFYAGRNHQYHGDAKLPRAAFKTQADYESYKRGWRQSAAENRLDNDTEWDD
jgi:hypothetical protein